MKKLLLSFALLFLFMASFAQKTSILPISASQPNKYQLEQINRKYGMFIHFGINTFHDEEWSDGSLPAVSYNPKNIDAEQWVKTAKNAGMKYVILVTKHHDGFCLWDSKYTDYDVQASSNKTNVVSNLAKACKKYNIGLGLYYSLWDRKQNGDVENVNLDDTYNKYMINQINELLDLTKKEKVNIVEFWFDGGWLKTNKRWPTQAIYNTIKSKAPACQIGINWNIGLPNNEDAHTILPDKQKENYPIRYFPSDFRLGDPYLPANPDPKVFNHDNKPYYMPWESTICMSSRWFFNTKDTTYKSIETLANNYNKATAQNNILILNCPPNRDGKMRERDIELLKDLGKKLNLVK
ncbi:calcium:sodium exchange protein [Pedobacter frigidisoli]|uniref:alpha-L-fucosidase n=1 Tax=Pedobacter frigidisoli TaxID=2530455 RepID=A0A4R0P6K3_9SPHI|nr:alpha-L-fucosidase [Pedobacter frigidisoli]TCD11108.1 calcium:sodium exchange protein [Pedobacter frigidisoli]